VPHSCAWQHPAGLVKQPVDCLSADGGPAQSFNDIWLCMDKAGCEITGGFLCQRAVDSKACRNSDEFSMWQVFDGDYIYEHPSSETTSAKWRHW